MFSFLKNKELLLTQKLFKLQSKEKEVLKENAAFISSIAVLTTEEIYQEINIKSLVNQYLKVDKTDVYSFRKFTKEQEITQDFFTDKDINRKGVVVNSDFNTFLNTKYNLLILLSDKNNLYLELASAISKASYKVGFSDVNSDLLDLVILSDIDNVDSFLSELKKYLIILKKLPKQENLTAEVIL